MHPTAVRHEEYAPGRDPGKVRHLSIKELWIQEAYRMKEFPLVSVDTLLNWADIGTKARTSERLTSLLRQMPLRLRERGALACLTLMKEEYRAIHGGGWRRFAMDEPRILRWMLCDHAGSTAASPSCSRMDSAKWLIVIGIVGWLHQLVCFFFLIQAHCGDPLCCRFSDMCMCNLMQSASHRRHDASPLLP